MSKDNNNAKAGKFQDYLDVTSIICHSQKTTSDAVISELVELVTQKNPALDCETVKQGVFAREALFPTVIAPGLAMPHARVADLDRLIVALATSKSGIRFGSDEDGEMVKVVVLVLAPADNPGLHLHVVSSLAREFSDLEKIGKLADLETVEEVVKFFGVMPIRLPEYLKAGDLACGIGSVLLEQDNLAFAFRKFGESRAEQIPVLDDNGNLRGVIKLKNILKYNIPLDLLEKDDLSELYDLAPYAEVISRAGDIKVSEVMSGHYETVSEELPAAKLIKLFLGTPEREVLVVDNEGRLRGEIKLRDFAAKIFWE